MAYIILPFLLLFSIHGAVSQQHDPGYNSEVIRGEVWVERAPIYGDRPDPEYPLSRETAGKRALREAALFFSGMIYGWSFHYDIGERARGIAEEFDVFEPMGEIAWGDPRLSVTEVDNRDTRMLMWADYRLNEVQQKRMHMWQT